MKTRTLWLGLGAAALTSTIPAHAPQAALSVTALEAAAPGSPGTPCRDGSATRTDRAFATQVAENHQHGAPAKTGAGGEGGEGGANADADARLDPMVRFYRNIQLVRGHLLVGDELVKAGLWADALPHFLHPVEELYDTLGPELKTLKMKPFLQQLKALAQTVKAKNATAYAGALAALTVRLDGVDAGMKAKQSDWLPFAVETAVETMRTAIGEYGQSIEAGKFAKAVEYQDSRGFVWQAEWLLMSVDAALSARDAEAAARSKAEIATLKAAWPAALPPASPVMDPAAVAASISKIELALGGIR